MPAGRIESTQREFTVLAETDLRTPEQFNNLIIRDADGYLVRLKDVGRAEIEARDKRVIARFNGNSAVAIGVVKQSVANPLDVSKAVNEALPKIIEEPARRHGGRHRLRLLDLHRPLDRQRLPRDRRGDRCWSCW